jgi:hypothetical protein
LRARSGGWLGAAVADADTDDFWPQPGSDKLDRPPGSRGIDAGLVAEQQRLAGETQPLRDLGGRRLQGDL